MGTRVAYTSRRQRLLLTLVSTSWPLRMPYLTRSLFVSDVQQSSTKASSVHTAGTRSAWRGVSKLLMWASPIVLSSSLALLNWSRRRLSAKATFAEYSRVGLTADASLHSFDFGGIKLLSKDMYRFRYDYLPLSIVNSLHTNHWNAATYVWTHASTFVLPLSIHRFSMFFTAKKYDSTLSADGRKWAIEWKEDID